MYLYQKIQELRSENRSIKYIARELKISKNTVRKYLRNPNPPEFNKKDYPKTLSKFETEIKDMLDKDFIGTRIYSELIKLGYTGSLSTVHRNIREFKKFKKQNKLITTRFETGPGQQMQYDWKEWNLKIGGKPKKVYIHELILSYSRKKYYTYSLSIKEKDIIRAIYEGINYFGGIAPELVVDNPKQIVISHSKNEVIRFNDEFLRFCGLFGIKPNACENYRPRTKGKVERPFYYLQEHLLRGLEVSNLAEFEEKLSNFMDMYNQRIHSGLKETPEARFLKEKEFLKVIPKVEPTKLFTREFREVSNDGFISYNGGFYPVPMRLCFKRIMIEPFFGKYIKIYDDKGVFAQEQTLNLFEDGIKPIHPEHNDLNKQFMEKREGKVKSITKKFIDLFEDDGEIYLEELRKTTGTNLHWHISEIMGFTEIYTSEEVKKVLNECTQIGAFHKNSVKNLLSLRKIDKPVIGITLPAYIFNNMNIKRDLSVYRVEV